MAPKIRYFLATVYSLMTFIIVYELIKSSFEVVKFVPYMHWAFYLLDITVFIGAITVSIGCFQMARGKKL